MFPYVGGGAHPVSKRIPILKKIVPNITVIDCTFKSLSTLIIKKGGRCKQVYPSFPRGAPPPHPLRRPWSNKRNVVIYVYISS